MYEKTGDGRAAVDAALGEAIEEQARLEAEAAAPVAEAKEEDKADAEEDEEPPADDEEMEEPPAEEEPPPEEEEGSA